MLQSTSSPLHSCWPRRWCFYRVAQALLLVGAVAWGHAAWADSAAAPTTVMYVSPVSPRDTNGEYEAAVLKMALELTADNDGPFELVPAPTGISHPRSRENMRTNHYENFIRSFGYREAMAGDENLTFIPFPIYRGILGYRICFESQKSRESAKFVRSLEDLSAFTFGHGIGWVDTLVLREAGLSVREISPFESLFKMLAANRLDFVCRGINEYLYEYETLKDSYKLNINQSFALHYEFPLYFYTNRKNTALIKRVEKGLMKAYEEGHFIALWQQRFAQSIKRAKLHERVLISLENPALKNLDRHYTQYLYDPEKEKY